MFVGGSHLLPTQGLSAQFPEGSFVLVVQRLLFENAFLRKNLNDYTLTYVAKLDEQSRAAAARVRSAAARRASALPAAPAQACLIF